MSDNAGRIIWRLKGFGLEQAEKLTLKGEEGSAGSGDSLFIDDEGESIIVNLETEKFWETEEEALKVAIQNEQETIEKETRVLGRRIENKHLNQEKIRLIRMKKETE